jgi:hypothetical protein
MEHVCEVHTDYPFVAFWTTFQKPQNTVLFVLVRSDGAGGQKRLKYRLESHTIFNYNVRNVN